MTHRLKEFQKGSKILSTLEKKLKNGPDIDFDYIRIFNELQSHISKEIQFINLVFPEYTPHDEKNHISNCFRIADEILGEKVILSLNIAELFLLSICIYAHDWGMAINPIQKKYILSNFTIEESEKKWLLSEERENFLIFLRNEGIEVSNAENFENLPPSFFQKYIRQTHAERSGKRIFELLNELDPNYGIGESAKIICIGHTLEFVQLENQKNYPLQYSLLRKTVNIQALTIYVRLIDLFDLGEDRTPYILWKYVAPEDVNSKMEWAKHRALRPITCPQKQGLKIILVNGDAYDPEVYAALEDLRKYCEDQLRRSNDLLIRMNMPEYNLDIRHIEWDVKAHNFEPINIRFEFDRNKMFDILSSEIYQNDPYVFLRELLQNSIDAIRLRRELVIKNQGLDSQSFGKIEVTVEHLPNGDSVVTWTDDGIGMDKYIIKNYFSIAGKSYYRSSDFEKLGLKIDPISKYGIGILSCFHVANKIEINTYKDPNTVSECDPLEIIIPDISRQFRIEKKKKAHDTRIGTKIKIFVSASKIKKKNQDFSQLNVTHYLKKIAGFVEFPIFINENLERTVVLHPNVDKNRFQTHILDGWNIYQYNTSLQFSDVFLPQDIETAKTNYSLKIWDIKTDLQVEGFEGSILFFIPKNEQNHCIPDHSTGYTGVKIISGIGNLNSEVIRWQHQWTDHHTLIDEEKKLETFAVFNQGILLSKTEMPWEIQGNVLTQVSPRVKVIINFIGKNSLLIDISRSKPSIGNESWFIPISQAIINKIFKEEKILKSNKNSKLKLLKIGQLLSHYPISFRNFVDQYPYENVEIPLLKIKGKIDFFAVKEFGEKKIFEIPEPIINLFQKKLLQTLLKTRDEITLLSYWNGEDCVPLTTGDYHNSSAIIHEVMSFSNSIIKKHFHLCDEVRFLSPITDKSPILIQKILSPYHNEKLNVDSFLIKCNNTPESLSTLEISFLNEEMRFRNPLGYFVSHPLVYHFPKQFQNYFAYNYRIVNYDHPIAHELIRILSRIDQIGKTKQNADISIYIGNIVESFETLFSGNTNIQRTDIDLKNALNCIWESAYNAKIINKKLKERLIRIEICYILKPFEQIEDYGKIEVNKSEINSNFGKVITYLPAK
nr:ATP-binding protein [uncultured Methanoregula sp.]